MKISVVTVTKDRVSDLLQCLTSLLTQSLPLQEIIVVDNYSKDETTAIVKNLKKSSKVPITLIRQSGRSYPLIYNAGLKQAKSADWVVFIDDDCVADKNWFAEIVRSIKKYKDAAVILGESKTYYQKNIYSLATYLFDQVWKKSYILGYEIANYEILDNKNIAYNLKFLKKYQLFFDEDRSYYRNGAAEDCDLGLQIQRAGGKAYYASEMKVRHKDPDNLFFYFKKRVAAYVGYVYFKEKWNSTLMHITPKIKTKGKFKTHMFKVAQEANLPWWEKINFYSIVTLSVALSYFLIFVTSFNVTKKHYLDLYKS